jgi:hypothetical protein
MLTYWETVFTYCWRRWTSPAYFSVQGGASPFPALGIVSYYPIAALVPTQASSDTLFRQTFRLPTWFAPVYVIPRTMHCHKALHVSFFSFLCNSVDPSSEANTDNTILKTDALLSGNARPAAASKPSCIMSASLTRFHLSFHNFQEVRN